MSKDVIVLKDGTEVPADDFWLNAPMWLVAKYSEVLKQPGDKPAAPAQSCHAIGAEK